MYAMTLDPKRSHERNPDCPMRLTLAPDGRSWMCVDCGITIMWKRVDWHQLKESVRIANAMLRDVHDPHGVVQRARDLLDLELTRIDYPEAEKGCPIEHHHHTCDCEGMGGGR